MQDDCYYEDTNGPYEDNSRGGKVAQGRAVFKRKSTTDNYMTMPPMYQPSASYDDRPVDTLLIEQDSTHSYYDKTREEGQEQEGNNDFDGTAAADLLGESADSIISGKGPTGADNRINQQAFFNQPQPAQPEDQSRFASNKGGGRLNLTATSHQVESQTILGTNSRLPGIDEANLSKHKIGYGQKPLQVTSSASNE